MTLFLQWVPYLQNTFFFRLIRPSAKWGHVRMNRISHLTKTYVCFVNGVHLTRLIDRTYMPITFESFDIYDVLWMANMILTAVLYGIFILDFYDCLSLLDDNHDDMQLDFSIWFQKTKTFLRYSQAQLPQNAQLQWFLSFFFCLFCFIFGI